MAIALQADEAIVWAITGMCTFNDKARGDPDAPPQLCFPDQITLNADDIHVVRFRLDKEIDGGGDILDDNERERGRRFVFERDRRRFVIAHAWVRIVLGRCLDRKPESLQFTTGVWGKPALLESSIDLRFNLSHAGERGVVALTLGREVGIDIEQERALDVFELSSRFFAPSETEALHDLAQSERIPAFFRCWTRKEAFIKALGAGLSFPLQGFEVSITKEPSVQLLRECSVAPEMLQCWRVLSLAIEGGYAGAIAAHAGDWRIKQWEAALFP